MGPSGLITSDTQVLSDLAERIELANRMLRRGRGLCVLT